MNPFESILYAKIFLNNMYFLAGILPHQDRIFHDIDSLNLNTKVMSTVG